MLGLGIAISAFVCLLSVGLLGLYKGKLNEYYKAFLKNEPIGDEEYVLHGWGIYITPGVLIGSFLRIPSQRGELVFYGIPNIHKLTRNIMACKTTALKFFLFGVVLVFFYVFGD
jgi:hypothetical protein